MLNPRSVYTTTAGSSSYMDSDKTMSNVHFAHSSNIVGNFGAPLKDFSSSYDDDDEDEVGYRALSGVRNELTPMYSQEESGATKLVRGAGVEKFARHHKEDQGVGGAPVVEGSS